jgi:hypothetical protein
VPAHAADACAIADVRDGAAVAAAIAERLARDRVDLAAILTSIIHEYYAEAIDIVSGLHEVRNGLAEIPGGHSA